MTDLQRADERGNAGAVGGGEMRRRRLIVGAAALALGIASERSARPIRAATGGINEEPMIIGQANSYVDTTFLGPETNAAPIALSVRGGFVANGLTDVAVHAVADAAAGTIYASGSVGPAIRGEGQGANGDTVGVVERGGKYGVYGSSDGNVGTAGISTADVGLVGYSKKYIGLYAEGPSYAAYLAGDVIVTGSLAVPGAKSAVVAHADGSHRLVYCEEAPESWLTDYGQGNLVAGKAEVKIAADFAAVVKADDYLVLLTPEGDSNGLYVTNKTAQGFAVREQKGGASNLVFTYRIAATSRGNGWRR